MEDFTKNKIIKKIKYLLRLKWKVKKKHFLKILRKKKQYNLK